ncbi:hypothetical protein [Polyangium aurulentum]|uniref:hypothetical protein n=1 Tax=Polyangium aurulentum TaxID=2567896 RepID=UPI0010AED6CA|nr:hypothetical protein [Polyangium aurulentum]UQA58561.1 hypothetical protein E8A73_046220 [Polyangium aurulentum]
MHAKLQGFEELNRRVWGDKVVLGLTAHTLGGIGVGLLSAKRASKMQRRVGFGLIAISTLAHIYALMTMRLGNEASGGKAQPRA